MPAAEKLIELEIYDCNCDNLSDLLCEMSSLRKLRLRSCDLTDLQQRYAHLSTSLIPEAVVEVFAFQSAMASLYFSVLRHNFPDGMIQIYLFPPNIIICS